MHDLIAALQWFDAANRAQSDIARITIAFPALTLLLFVMTTPYEFAPFSFYWKGNIAMCIGIAHLCLWHWDPFIAAFSILPFVLALYLYKVGYASHVQSSRGATAIASAAEPAATRATPS